jgi:hypothetical protein
VAFVKNKIVRHGFYLVLPIVFRAPYSIFLRPKKFLAKPLALHTTRECALCRSISLIEMQGRNNGYGVYDKEEDEEGVPLERESADGAFGVYVSGDDDDDVDGLDESSIDFDDPKIANLPRIILMGPRRAGKTSIQVKNLFPS